MLRIAAILVFLSVSFVERVPAGTLCGTVRNAATLAPISGAAVFLFEDSGVSTGLNTGTALDGSWCLGDVPPGTYTIVVDRDDYEIARVDGIVVEDTATDVDISAQTGVLFAPAFPNPASDSVALRWRVPSGVAYTLEIFDLRGRRVTGWFATGTGADRSFEWGLREADGAPLPSAAYFAVLRTTGARRVQRISVVR